jgi:L-ascorbate metabolism protein UlaG (beta-lactamase superfamily)
MIQPLLRDLEFLMDVETAVTERDVFHVWWLGQSGFLLYWKGAFALLDPYLSDSLTNKYAGTDRPHVRMTELVIAPSQLGFIQVITASHQHTDHLDPETLRPLVNESFDVTLICPEACRRLAFERSGLPNEKITGLDAGESFQVGPFLFEALPAAHEALDRDASGKHLYLGFLITFGPFTVYHSGDTVRYDGMEQWLGKRRIDLALLPINGRNPERRVAGNLSGREAAQLAHDNAIACVIPCHYEMFEFNTASPEEFEVECQRLNQPYKVLRAGERWTSPKRSIPKPPSA